MKRIIGFSSLEIKTIIGVYPEEKERLQPLFIDLKVSLSSCGEVLADTIDYDALVAICQMHGKEKHYGLIESYAEDLLQKLFQHSSKIEAVELQVRKPQAIPAATYAFVLLSAERKEFFL